MAELDSLTAVYQAAMRPDPVQLPGRRSIMARHATYDGFRALAVTAGDAERKSGSDVRPDAIANRNANHPDRARGRARPAGDDEDEPATDEPATTPGSIIAFSYGFRGENGQWWHDVVAAALIARSGPAIAARWLADSLEIAEVHVHPAYHRRGIGRSLVLGLAAGRRERTAVLSTQDAESPARHLYRGLGFTDLLTGYAFPGTPVPYAVMGAELPLAGASGAAGAPGAPRSPSPSSR
jgi:ribosomal protein S18 acetylase RimI-like enzyme